jgi:hypothetical protein
MSDYDLRFVRDAFYFDQTTTMRAKGGWHYETFLLFQSMFMSKKIADFTIERANIRLAPISRSRSRFLFYLLQATDEATLAPF